MPEYALTLHFGATNDEHARKRADNIADLAAVEHGTRNPVVVPVDGELRNRYADAILQAGDGESVGPHTAADAVLAIRDDELEQLRAANTRYLQRIHELATAHRTATAGRDEAKRLIGVQQARAERAEAERDAAALIVAELQALRDSLYGHLESAQQRAEQAEAVLELVRAQGAFWAACAAETVAAFSRGVLALLDAPSGHDSPATPQTDDHPHTDTNPPTRNDHEAPEGHR